MRRLLEAYLILLCVGVSALNIWVTISYIQNW